MGKKSAGTVYVKVDGQQVRVTGKVETPASDITRSSVMATDGVAGYKEERTAPYVKCEVVVGKNFPLKKIMESDDLTVTAEQPFGIYVLTGGFVTEHGAYDGNEGVLDLTFEGENGEYQ